MEPTIAVYPSRTLVKSNEWERFVDLYVTSAVIILPIPPGPLGRGPRLWL